MIKIEIIGVLVFFLFVQNFHFWALDGAQFWTFFGPKNFGAGCRLYRNLLKFGTLLNWANIWGVFLFFLNNYFWALGPNFGPFLVRKIVH